MAGLTDTEWQRSLPRPEDVDTRTMAQLQYQRTQQVDGARDFTDLNIVQDFNLDAMLRYAKIIPTDQSIHFLSKDNLERIHARLEAYVARHTKHRIVRQNPRDVFSAMILIYQHFLPMDMRCMPMKRQIEKLNRVTVERLGRIAIRNLRLYLGYMRDRTGAVQIIDRAVRDHGVKPGYLPPKGSMITRDPLFGNTPVGRVKPTDFDRLPGFNVSGQ